MADKMKILTFKDTGHVLGIVTIVGDPEGKYEPKDFVGDGFPVRDGVRGTVGITLKPEVMKVETVDFDPYVLMNPALYCFKDGALSNKPAVQSVTFTSSELKVTLSAAPTTEVEVYYRIEGGTSAFTNSDKFTIPTTQDFGKAQLSLGPGVYYAFVMPKEYRAVLKRKA